VSRVPNYDLIAPYYDKLASVVFGNQLVLAQNYFLSALGNPKRILVFGGGTGHMLVPMLQLYPNACIHFIESSSAMITKAKSKVIGVTKSIYFICGTEQDLVDKANTYDVILTPFVLDVFETKYLANVFSLLLESLSPGGRWIQTDFNVNHHSSIWKQALLWLMYRFFKVVAGQHNQKLPDFRQYFDNSHLRILDQKEFYHQMVTAVLYEKI